MGKIRKNTKKRDCNSPMGGEPQLIFLHIVYFPRFYSDHVIHCIFILFILLSPSLPSFQMLKMELGLLKVWEITASLLYGFARSDLNFVGGPYFPREEFLCFSVFFEK